MPDLQAEYRFRPPDQDALKAIADATGGAVSPTADVLRKAPQSSRAADARSGPASSSPRSRCGWLDILLRRVRVFETA